MYCGQAYIKIRNELQFDHLISRLKGLRYYCHNNVKYYENSYLNIENGNYRIIFHPEWTSLGVNCDLCRNPQNLFTYYMFLKSDDDNRLYVWNNTSEKGKGKYIHRDNSDRNWNWWIYETRKATIEEIITYYDNY